MHSVWPSLSVTLLDSVEVLACFLVCTQCGCILFAVQYCCGWSCGTQTGALALLCVLSSQMCTEHWGVTDHYPSGRWSLCVYVCVCVQEREREKSWLLFYFSRTSHLPSSALLSTASLGTITWLAQTSWVLHLTSRRHMSTFPEYQKSEICRVPILTR